MNTSRAAILTLVLFASVQAGAKVAVVKDFQLAMCSLNKECIEVSSKVANMASAQTLLTVNEVEITQTSASGKKSTSTYESGYVDLTNQKLLLRSTTPQSIEETEISLVNLETRKFSVPL